MFKKIKNCKLTKREIDQESTNLLRQMTLEEKVLLLNGNWNPLTNLVLYQNPYNPKPIETNGCERLNISSIKFSDGPRGVVMGKSTCFPVSMARGASFDRNLERRIGNTIGKEARAQGANYFGGVCINLLRHPAWGRAQETYGEDPFLLGEMGKALTESVQEHNVIACLKHYAVNSIENSRFRVNVKVDERSLREVYLPHFKKSIKAGAASVMGAYNLYEGEYCCENDFLLNKILRDDWGFEGFTISDFIFGIRDGVKAIKSGMDVEMPQPIHYHQKLLDALEQDKVEEATIDKAVLRVIKTLMLFENCPDPTTYSKKIIANKEHIALAREAAEQSMVLIKNDNGLLPLSKSINHLLVVGRLAKKPNLGDYGSSRVRPPSVVTYWDGIKKYLGSDVKVSHCSETELNKVKKLASEADAVLIVAGYDHMDEGECLTPDPKAKVGTELITEGLRNSGNKFASFLSKILLSQMAKKYSPKDGTFIGGDRTSLSLRPEMIKLIQCVADLNSNIVVSLVTGSMIITEEWEDKVSSILYSWYSGMEGGNALAKILFGAVNPSGKLPFVQPHKACHLPYFSSTDGEITYDLYHGYTLLDKKGIQPAYPFGYGLSYTQFKYGNLKLEDIGSKVQVSFDLSNIGKMDGAEVVQIYVGMKESKIDRQKKLLKGFEKIFLTKGSTQKVTIHVEKRELEYFDIKSSKWKFENGEYLFFVGGSSDNTQLLSDRISL